MYVLLFNNCIVKEYIKLMFKKDEHNVERKIDQILNK